METSEFVFSMPLNLGSRCSAVVLSKNSSLVDKMEQAYFSKGFM